MEEKLFFIAILRQVILLIPLVLVLPYFFKLNGLFYAFPVTDLFAAGITFFIIRRDIKKIDKKHMKSSSV